MRSSPRMEKVITALCEKYGVNLKQVGASLRLDMPGFDRLCVERISTACISVAHYFELDGDLVAEPDIVFFADFSGAWFPISISQSITGWREYAELTDAGIAIARYKPKAQKGLADFAEMWAQNIKDQGWLENGVGYTYARRGDNVSD
jgi:hypothetical protein